VATQPKTNQRTTNQRKTNQSKAKQTAEDRDALLAKIKTDFDERLATVASDPRQWVTFIDQVALFGLPATAWATNCC